MFLLEEEVMHDRLTARRWMLAILLVGVLLATPLAVQAAERITSAPGLDAKVGAGDGTGGGSALNKPVYNRNLVWWPYSSGPYYGDKRLEGAREDDILITQVGTFRTTSRLAVPRELTNAVTFAGGKQYFLIQLRPSALSQPFADVFASTGIEIVEPVPVNGLIVRMDRAAFQLASSSPLIQFIEPYHAAFKINPNIGTVPQATPEAAASSQSWLVLNLFKGEPTAPVLAQLARMGITSAKAWDDATGGRIELHADVSAIPTLARIESVSSITETSEQRLMGRRGALYLQSPSASAGDYPYWKVGLQGDGQILQVSDSGMSVNAFDFADQRSSGGWSAGNPSPHDNVVNDHRKVVAYFAASKYGGAGNLLGCDALTNGSFSHGQLVSSTAIGSATRGLVPAPSAPGLFPSPTDQTLAQNPNQTWARAYGNGYWREGDIPVNTWFNEYTDSGYDGVGKGAKLVFVDSDASCPEGNVTAGNLQNTIEDTWKTYKATVHNFSFGSAASTTSGPSYTTGANNIDAVTDPTRGYPPTATGPYPINLTVIAAGNAGAITGGNGSSTVKGNIDNEASCKNCISAGASDGVGGFIAYYTSEGPGPGTSGRHVVTVLAEGLDTGCRRDNATESQTVPPSCVDMTNQGTSFASPNLAGAATVIREYFEQGFYPDGTDQNPSNAGDKVRLVSGRLIRAMMIAAASPIVRDDLNGLKVCPKNRFNHVWGWGQFFLNKALPLAAYPQNTVNGLIVHDQPGDLDYPADGTNDGVSNLTLPATASTTVGSVGSSEFQVLGVTQDLSVGLVWDDPVNATGALVDDLDLEVSWCGPDQDCSTTADNVTWKGDVFTDDINENLAINAGTEVDLASDAAPTGYWYSISNQDLTAAGATLTNYKNSSDNMEGIYIATKPNAPDLNADGTPDIRYLEYRKGGSEACTYQDPNDASLCMRTGKWKIEVFRRSGTTNNLPFSVAILGPVSAGSAVRFDANPVTCNGDQDVVVNETADASDPGCTSAASCPAATIASRLVVEVLNNGTVVDTESGTAAFLQGNLTNDPPGTLQFRLSKRLPVSSAATPANNDGVLNVNNNYTLRVSYNDVKGATTVTRTSLAGVDCQPNIGLYVLRQIGPDAPFALAGGCDGDRYLDQGEQFSLTLQYFNADPVPLVDATASLAAYNFGTTTPSTYLTVDSPSKPIGTLAPVTLQRTTFGLKVVGTPPARTKVDLAFCVSGPKTGQGVAGCTTTTFLLQADDERHFYITDCPTGCGSGASLIKFDRNYDEKFETVIGPNPYDPIEPYRQGFQEVVQGTGANDLPNGLSYEDMTSTAGACVGGGCGNPSFDGPWDFDASDKGFRGGHNVESSPSPTTTSITQWGEDANWNGTLDAGEDANGNSKLDQNWGTAGGCGWMSKGAGTTGGIWHTGTIGNWAAAHTSTMCGGAARANDSICEQYDIEAGTTGTYYWWEALRSPTIHPVHFGTDPDGYDWSSQILDWSWNAQVDVGDNNAHVTWEFDLDTNNGEPLALGDQYIARNVLYRIGLITGGSTNLYNGGPAFAATDHTNTSTTYGDEANGTKGTNRAGKRGCYFNDLNTISDGAPMTAAQRLVATMKPVDDDCDNNYTLGANGCPGACNVDDDGNGLIDDVGEICPCKKCSGGPRNGWYCTSDSYCTAGGATLFLCQNATNASGVPTAYGDDVCGNASTDENVNATIVTGTTSGLRQVRNFEVGNVANGIGGSGRNNGQMLYNTLEDFYGPVGKGWGSEVGFIVQEATGTTAPVPSYGLGVDDMVLEWQETHPVAQVANNCTVSNARFGTLGACASITAGSIYNAGNGDQAIPVTVNDPFPTGNLGECTVGATPGIYIKAFSTVDLLGERFCLVPAAVGSNEYSGIVKVTTRLNVPNDGYVYIAYNGFLTGSIRLRYFDKQDGVAAHNYGPGADGQPGIAGFDDDGDGTVDNASEQCSDKTQFALGRSPHNPGTPARWSDDTCGCVNNPVDLVVFTDFDTADIVVSDARVTDSCAGCDNDGYADSGEQVQLDVRVRNLSNFPIENIDLKLATTSPLVQCVTDDSVKITRLSKQGVAGSEIDTFDGSDHFGFIAAVATRTATGDDFSSSWTVAFRGTAKAGLNSFRPDPNDPTSEVQLTTDLPVNGTATIQSFKLAHNLQAASYTRAADFFDNMESYGNDAQAVCTPSAGTSTCSCTAGGLTCYIKRNTGDDTAELKGTHCAINSPSNQYGNNTDPDDYCEIGEGMGALTENHWHLERGSALNGKGTVCERTSCIGGDRSHSGAGTKNSLASGVYTSFDPLPYGNSTTSIFNRMYWLKTKTVFALGTGRTLNGNSPVACTTAPCSGSPSDQAPVLEYWTQLSILDWRFSGPVGAALEAAGTYVCVDKNSNGDCDTKEDGTKDGSEKWEILKAYYSPETTFRLNNYINCSYDPSDDGNTEFDYYNGSVAIGPSSTCYPNSTDTCVGRTEPDASAANQNALEPVVLWSGCWPETGKEGSEGATGVGKGRWIKKLYNLRAYRGQKVVFRWHVAPFGIPGAKTCADFGPGACGNSDDGWYLDDLRVYGLATGGTLSVDNAAHGSATCPSTTVSGLKARLSAIEYPRNNVVTSAPKPAAACASSDAAPLNVCDWNTDSTLDSASTTANSAAAGRPYVLDASYTSADTCAAGALEFQFVDNFSNVVRDWLTDPITYVNPAVTTTYTVNTRCSTAPATVVTTAVTIIVPSPCAVTQNTVKLLSTNSISWQGNGTFDVAKGNVTTMRNAGGSFASATCFANNTSSTSVTDTNNPTTGNGNYYLVRCDATATGTSSWNDGTETGNRNSTLTACP